MNTELILKKLKKLRMQGRYLIHVSNKEWYSLFKDEIRNSIAIEGIFTNRADLINVLEHNKKTDKHKAASILGYFESASTMYEYASTQYAEKEFSLRISDIKQMHTLLMRYEKQMGFYTGELGDLRKTRVEVTHSTFTPISEFYIRPALETLVAWVNFSLKQKDSDPVSIAAISHVWFESIHPFRDGNGRVGRILLSYILIGCGLINIAIKGISKRDRDFYYQALEQADNGFEAFHRDMEQGIQLSLKNVHKYIRPSDFNTFSLMIHDRLNNSVSSITTLDKDTLDQETALPLSDLAKIYDYSQDYLRNLINQGKLKGLKKGKTWYVQIKEIAAYIKRVS